MLPRECANCRGDSSECRLRAVGEPCCASCRCDVPILIDDRSQLAAELMQAQKELEQARALLLRAEPFLPERLRPLLTDVRAFLRIDERGFRLLR